MTKTSDLRVAFVFPGQGSQSVGMGRTWVEARPETEEVFDRADKALGVELKQLCWEGPEEELQLTGTIYPADLQGVSIFWSSLNPEVATVTPGGLLKGISVGSIRVVASAGRSSDTCSVIVTEVVGVFDIKEHGIQLFPNPVDDVLHIRGISGQANISVLSLSGVTLIQSNQHQLKLGTLRPGAYVLKVEDGEKVSMQRIMKL